MNRRHSLHRGVLAATLSLVFAGSAFAQQKNELDQIKQDVADLQKLVREIEGRLFILQQRLGRLKTVGKTEIDKNADLLKRIFNQLSVMRTSGKLKSVKINVTVMSAGVVVLKGQVANTDQLKEVLEAVRKVPGVKSIVNEIKIGGSTDTTTTMFFDGDEKPKSKFLTKSVKK